MRTQNRNKTFIWYANFVGKIPVQAKDEYGNPITDEYGNPIQTGESETIHTDPVRMMANVSPARGESNARMFGESEDYDKVIVFAGTSPVSETSILWIDNLVDKEIPQVDGVNVPHNYIVQKVAESLNSTSLAVKKVIVSNG